MQTVRTRPRRESAAGGSGFTLVELLVVIGIIGILAAMLTPALIAALRRAHETSTLNLIHQCEVAAQSFFNDYGDYPPSTWAGIDELFGVPNPNPANPAWDGGLFSDVPGTNGYITDVTGPNIYNQGIEVFVACLATKTGGPYLQLSDGQVGNTDIDYDDDKDGDLVDDVRQTTNHYFGVDDAFEIVDWWENPLVYVHNRDYASYDGWHPEWVTPGFETPPAGPLPWAVGVEAVPYFDAEGNLWPCYGRSSPDPLLLLPQSTTMGNYPNLDGFQLFSWSSELRPGCAAPVVVGDAPNQNESGAWPGWTTRSGNLTNWEE